MAARRQPIRTIRCGRQARRPSGRAHRRARRHPRAAGSRRRAATRPPRRAANGPQSLHRRSAPPADADRDGAWAARRRRCDPALSPDAWRDAALARHRSVGQRHAQDRRRGDRARSRAHGLPPNLGQGTGRVTGIEVLPTAAMGRPRVDVTWRISGLFRDLFPAQIALIDAAVRLRRRARRRRRRKSACRRGARQGTAARLARIFGAAPGAYGAGVEELLGQDSGRDAIGAAYLAATSHAYGGADGEGTATPGVFAARVASADLLLHGERRSFARSARRRRGRRSYRRLRRGRRLARARSRSHHARHDRSQPPTRAAARCGARQDRARPRRQSALHRRP